MVPPAGKHSCPGGRAYRGSSIEPVKPQTVLSHGIQVGSFEDRMAIIAGLPPTLVIGHKKYDVWPGILLLIIASGKINHAKGYGNWFQGYSHMSGRCINIGIRTEANPLNYLHSYSNDQNIINLRAITHPVRNGFFQDFFLLFHGLLVNVQKEILEVFTHEFLVVLAALLIHKSI